MDEKANQNSKVCVIKADKYNHCKFCYCVGIITMLKVFRLHTNGCIVFQFRNKMNNQWKYGQHI